MICKMNILAANSNHIFAIRKESLGMPVRWNKVPLFEIWVKSLSLIPLKG